MVKVKMAVSPTGMVVSLETTVVSLVEIMAASPVGTMVEILEAVKADMVVKAAMARVDKARVVKVETLAKAVTTVIAATVIAVRVAATVLEITETKTDRQYNSST